MISRAEVEKYVPVHGTDYDVIVVGGGPAGIGAAVASSLNGAKTILFEGRSYMGGVAAVAMWMPMNRLFLNGESRGGVHDRFVRKLQEHGNDASREGSKSWVNGDNLNIHPEYLRLAAFELLENAGCHYRLYSPVTDVLMEGNEVKGVVVTSKDGRQEFRARVVIDASGDGDVAYLAGADMVSGREDDGALMPVSLVFALANVDVERFMEFRRKNTFMSIIKEARKEGYATAAWYGFDLTTVPGVLNVNNGGLDEIGNVDGTKSSDLTVAERTGIQVAVDFVKLARDKKIPGLENCYLMRVGSNVGVRETRRIVGDYVMTVEDTINGPEFEDTVARRYGAIDPGGLGITEDLKTRMKSGHAYPYRSMLPRGIENLLVAGRCGSTTHLGQAAGKSMGNMMDLGQAAGVAAALASASNVTPRKLAVKRIQEALLSMGAKL